MGLERTCVELGPRSYSVFVGEGLLGGIDELLGEGDWRRALVVTDDNVGPLYADTVTGSLRRAGLEVALNSIEPGENSKSMHEALELIELLATSGMTRVDLLVALGGGVVGDLAGFVASVYKRGMPFLQVPTTLMAQVDSSIGGKTGVNLDCGKNLVGTFHQPVAVISDVETLSTLSEREYRSGMAEVAKYSFLRPEMWPTPLAESAVSLKGVDKAQLAKVVNRCAAIKAEIVSGDECDTGLRAVLNYGHTLGHALEAATGYDGTYTHGEAVSIGMVYAGIVSEEIGSGPPGVADRHREVLASLGLPTTPRTPPGFDAVLDAMRHDKKNRDGITMVLIDRDNNPFVRAGLETGMLKCCYQRLVS
ncbi:MAG: 3-dehydroquinate synthase [Actinobacteria bacterium]|nr:3-dehydroquinate synthase [Actinomycetota bacterium]MCG2819949.1 3-dehydroquinate synthase [Actinomycetes bacterium]MBU4218930.1 3-dehydroquinate synthase [Actinomycetota bacterium]MBU4359799.1 3-dehydroquinate synthase [Actinomycetota bacterium]MBU4390995.1 3-dehydroquinate synthase [Actinomycetota bacterium]